jgi:superfamily I DNA/RNA helicase
MQGQINFDDQLYMTVCFRARIETFEVIFVDESQDLSPIQHEMLKMGLRMGGRLIAVGDSYQSIYGFRGADTDSMKNLARDFKMKVMPLTFCFRCGSEIVREAQRVMPTIQPSANAQRGIVDKLEKWSLQDIERNSTILCRNVAPLVVIGFRMIRHGIGATICGRDIGAGLKKLATKFSGQSPAELITNVMEWWKAEDDKAKAKEDWNKVEQLTDRKEALCAIISLGNCKSSGELINGIDRLFGDEAGKVLLSTIHKAKGLEWNRVYILDSWRMPSKWAKNAAESNPDKCSWMLDQERNLRYIAITRAQKHLTYINTNGCKELEDTDGGQQGQDGE